VEPAFYCLVYGGMPMDPTLGTSGVEEVTVRDVPMKPPALATLKSNNYLLNCLTAMRACDQGGHFGVLVDDNGMVNAAAPPLHAPTHVSGRGTNARAVFLTPRQQIA